MTISELQQEEATLHALGLLDADEADAFERQLDVDAELSDLVRELQEAAAALSLAGDGSLAVAPPGLRARVLTAARLDGQSVGGSGSFSIGKSHETNKLIKSQIPWIPWAIAALFLGSSCGLFWLVKNHATPATYFASQPALEKSTPPPDPLTQVSFCALEPTPEFTTAQPRAVVLWDAAHREGKLRVNRLAPPPAGKDYQLWTVEAGRKEPVSAGVVHVDADGQADLPFQPVSADAKPVVAVAISLEQAGGSPTNQGPILLLGKF